MNRAFTSFILIVATVLLGLPAATATAHDQAASDAAIPANLAAPPDSVHLFSLSARGVQIYTCEAKPDDATAYEWTFKAPEAELLNAEGVVVGQHFAGPTWQGLDGSAVVAKVQERADAPESGAIPWLLLEATEHTESGAFATITHIQRLDTVEGVAPGEGCDAAHAGAEAREPYEATYAFYYPAAPDTLSAATPAD
jgi:hypothetical protein